MGPKPALLGFVFLCVTVVHSLFGHTEPPDPHLLKARRLIDRYEEGRPEAARDYESETYARAMELLEQVSGSATEDSEARSLMMEIRGKIASQKARVRSRNRDLAARQEARQRRDLAFIEGTRRIVSGPDEDSERKATPRKPDPTPPPPSARGAGGAGFDEPEPEPELLPPEWQAEPELPEPPPGAERRDNQ
jgi:hypothetical protein